MLFICAANKDVTSKNAFKALGILLFLFELVTCVTTKLSLEKSPIVTWFLLK